MADIDELVVALKNADAAGDTVAASRLAAAIQQHQQPAAAGQSAASSAATAPPKARIESNPISAALTAGAQGATLGFADEMAAGLGAGLVAPFSKRTLGEVYRDQLAVERGNLDASREQYPKMFFGGEVAGSIAPTARIAKAVGALRNIPTWMRTAFGGAAGGGLYGAGTAEEGERTESAATGAAVGGVAAPLVSTFAKPLLTGGRNLARLTWNKITQTPKREAQRLVADAMRNDLLTPDDVLRLKSNPNLVVADLGENVAGLARGAAARPGPFRAQAANVLNERQAGQQGRLIDTLGVKGPQEFKDGFDNWAESRITAASQKYDEAYAASFDASSPQMKALLQKPAMQDALKEAERKIANESGVKGGNVQRLDAAKRALDDKIGAAQRAGHADEARILTNIKRELVAEMDRQVPAYAQARGIFAGHASIRNAADTGTTLFDRATSHDEARRLVTDMSPSEFEAFRRGAFRGLIDMLERTPESRNAAQKLIESTAVRDKARLMFQNDADFERFVKNAIDESRMSYTKNMVLGGSPTARIQEEGRAIRETGEIVSDAISGNHLKLFGRFLRSMGFGDPSQETLDELAKLLLSNPSKRTITNLQRVTNAPAPRPITPRTQTRAGVTAGTLTGGGVMD